MLEIKTLWLHSKLHDKLLVTWKNDVKKWSSPRKNGTKWPPRESYLLARQGRSWCSKMIQPGKGGFVAKGFRDGFVWWFLFGCLFAKMSDCCLENVMIVVCKNVMMLFGTMTLLLHQGCLEHMHCLKFVLMEIIVILEEINRFFPYKHPGHQHGLLVGLHPPGLFHRFFVQALLSHPTWYRGGRDPQIIP